MTLIFIPHHADLPQLDELAGSEPKGELPLLRPQQWAHPLPGAVDNLKQLEMYFQLMNFIKPGTCDMKKVVDKVKLDGLTSQKQHFEVRTCTLEYFSFALRCWETATMLWNVARNLTLNLWVLEVNIKIQWILRNLQDFLRMFM